MSHKHETIRRPFADLHNKGGHVIATLLHDPTVEGLDVALYIDGSASMEPAYGPRGILAKLAPVKNLVEPQVQWMLEYLASKDRNGTLRTAYWATGDGAELEPLGELTAESAKTFRFPGPQRYGKGTVLLPVLRDFVAYLREQVKRGARRGLAVVITDSQLHDAADVRAYSAQVAKEITAGRLPRVHFVFVGVGEQVDEEQMEEVAHDEYPGVGHLWCHRVADRMEEMAELVAVLVDETMTVAAGGTIYDDQGRVLKTYEGRLPAVLEFDVPSGCKEFTPRGGRPALPPAAARRGRRRRAAAGRAGPRTRRHAAAEAPPLMPGDSAHRAHGEPGHVHGPGCSHDHAPPAHGEPGHVHGPGCSHDHAPPAHGEPGHVHGPGCSHDHAHHHHHEPAPRPERPPGRRPAEDGGTAVQLDLEAILPRETNEIGRFEKLEELLRDHRAVRDAHIRRDGGHAELCVHFDERLATVDELLALARLAGASTAKRYEQKTWFVRGMDAAQCATVIEYSLARMAGVLEANVAYAAERLVVEFDRKAVSPEAIERRVAAVGYVLETPDAGARLLAPPSRRRPRAPPRAAAVGGRGGSCS